MDAGNSSFDNGVQFAWDSTSIKLIEDCLYKYKLRIIDGWTPRRKSVHLLFGGWYATALEHFYKYLALGDSRDLALHRVVRETLEATWLRPTEGHPENNGPWTSDHPTKTRENLIRTIVWYVDEFANDPTEMVFRQDGQPAVEFSFSFEATPGIILAGHIDRLVTYQGDPFVMDQKTSAQTITPHYFEQYDPDTQMSLYTLAGKIIYQLPVKGVIIDAAQVAVGFTRYLRGFTFRDPAKLEEWLEVTLDRIGQAQHYTERGFFPMNPSSCHKYAGCEFRNVCNRSPHVREQFLQADFTQGPRWSPLDRR